MTPKEKAKELIFKFEITETHEGKAFIIQSGKSSALICVDEIIDTYNNAWTNTSDYWKEVKNEIEKL